MPTFDAYHALVRMCEGPLVLLDHVQLEDRPARTRRLGRATQPQIRERRLVRFLLSVLLGKPTLVRHFVDRCPDFVVADSLPELARRMGEVTGDGALDAERMAPRCAGTTR